MRVAHLTDLHWRKYLEGTSEKPHRACRLMPYLFEKALDFLKGQRVDLLLLTGDLVDVPEAKSESDVISTENDYRELSQVLCHSRIPFLSCYGNHDDAESYFKFFPKQPFLEFKDLEFHVFYDHQFSAQPIFRADSEWERFRHILENEGPRNQIHLQHYLIHPNRNKSFPHTYANSKEIKDKLEESQRVLASCSGHFHPGAIEKDRGLVYLNAPSFCEYPHKIFIYEFNSNSDVLIEDFSIEKWFGLSDYHSPYRGMVGRWFKGNLHTHNSEDSACATVPLEEGVSMYQAKGYDFLGLTNHDVVTPLNLFRKKYPNMLFYSGYEHSTTEHMLFISSSENGRVHQQEKKKILEQNEGLLSILCHPQGPKQEYWSLEKLKEYKVLPTGLEIYNAHYAKGPWAIKGYSPVASELWNQLLDQGKTLWGFANDDFHDGAHECGEAFNLVCCSNPSEIFLALQKGAFFASTGLEALSSNEYNGHIVLSLKTPALGQFIGPGGEILAESEGVDFEFKSEGLSWVRFEAKSEKGQLWSQPWRQRLKV